MGDFELWWLLPIPALFFAMAGVEWLAPACLYVGLVLVLGATALYLREAARLSKAAPST